MVNEKWGKTKQKKDSFQSGGTYNHMDRSSTLFVVDLGTLVPIVMMFCRLSSCILKYVTYIVCHTMLAILPLQILQHPNPARGGAAPGRSGFQRHALLFRLCGFFDLDDVQT